MNLQSEASIHQIRCQRLVIWSILLIGLSSCQSDPDGAASAGHTGADYFLLRAKEALHEDAPNEALRMVARAIRSDSLDAKAFFLAGEAYRLLGRTSEEEAAYRRVVRIDPSFPEAWMRLGNLAYTGGDPRTALTLYRRQLRIRETADLWYNIGAAYRALFLPDSARAAGEQALALDSRHAPSHSLLSEVAEFEGDDSEAMREAEAALKLAPGNPLYQKRVAMFYLRNDRAEEAASLLSSSLSHDFLDPEAHYNLGQAYLRLGRTVEAQRSLQRRDKAERMLEVVQQIRTHLQENPEDTEAMRRLAHLYLAGARRDESIRLYRSILYHDADDIPARIQLATVLALDGNPVDAEVQYRKVLARDSTRANVWMYLGTLLVREGRPDEGNAALDRAVELDPALRARAATLRHAE